MLCIQKTYTFELSQILTFLMNNLIKSINNIRDIVKYIYNVLLLLKVYIYI